MRYAWDSLRQEDEMMTTWMDTYIVRHEYQHEEEREKDGRAVHDGAQGTGHRRDRGPIEPLSDSRG